METAPVAGLVASTFWVEQGVARRRDYQRNLEF
jgi:hypothetical protein